MKLRSGAKSGETVRARSDGETDGGGGGGTEATRARTRARVEARETAHAWCSTLTTRGD